MEDLTANEHEILRSDYGNAEKVFNSTYDYSSLEKDEAGKRRVTDSLALSHARRVMALVDRNLGQPNCNLSLDDYMRMISDLPGYAKEELSASAFFQRFGFKLPNNDEAVRLVREEQRLKYKGRDLVIPKGDYVYFFSYKIGEDRKPKVDKDNVVVFTLTESTYGMKR